MSGFMAGGGTYEAFYPATTPPGSSPLIYPDPDISIIYDKAYGGSFSAPAADSPVSLPSGVVATSIQRYFFYDTIQLTPTKFQLGVIASDQVLQVEVWNAFLSSSEVTNQTETGAEGLTNRFIEYAEVVGVNLRPLEQVTWEFSVSKTVGPAVFDAFEFLWVDGKSYKVEIAGTRAQLWAFTHNWEESLVETVDWLSAVNTSYLGDEHRASLRKTPRLSQDSTLYLSRDSSKKLDHLLYAKQTDFFTAPMHQFLSRLTAPIVAGDTEIYLDTTDRGFTKGAPIIVMDSLSSSATSGTILEVHDDHLVLSSGHSKDWPAGASVYPAGAARIVGEVPLRWETHDFAVGKVRLEFQPGYTPAFTPVEDYPATDFYDSGVGDRGPEEILLQEPDWANGLPRGFAYQSGIVDNPVGVVSLYQTRTRPERTIPYEWLLKNRQSVGRFRAFLQRRLGRTTPFWCTTWASDIRAIDDYSFSSGSHELRFYDHGFIAFSLQNYASESSFERTNLQIQLRNGQCFRARIESAESVDSEVSKVIFDRGFPFTFTANDVLRISFLNLYRLVSDSVAFEWLTPGVAKVSLGFVTVPDNISYIDGD